MKPHTSANVHTLAHFVSLEYKWLRLKCKLQFNLISHLQNHNQ